MIEIVIGAPNPRCDLVQYGKPNSVPGLTGIFVGGVRPRNLAVEHEFTAPHGVGGRSTVHPADERGGSGRRAEPGRLMESRVLPIGCRGYHPALPNGSVQRTH